MKTIKSISVPNPCHQSWQQMAPVSDGRHCDSCSKTVVDFGSMSDDEIIKYLAGNSKICGRFNVDQLQDINNRLSYNSKSDTRWRKWVMAAILFGSSIFQEANGQSKTALPQKIEHLPATRPNPDYKILGDVVVSPVQYKIIKGLVTDEANLPLPGVTVRLAGSDLATQTDINGIFTLKAPESGKQIKADFAGYLQGVIDISGAADTVYRLQLVPRNITIGEPAIMGYGVVRKTPLIKRVYYKCIATPFRKIFK